jgi:hypothetical protein
MGIYVTTQVKKVAISMRRSRKGKLIFKGIRILTDRSPLSNFTFIYEFREALISKLQENEKIAYYT